MKAQFGGNAIGLLHGKLNGADKRLGTAFCFLKPNWFVTAKHVVIDDDSNLLRNDLILTSKAGGNPIKVAFPKLIFVHEYHDIALLDVGGDYCEKPFYPAHHDFAGGKGFFKIGYNPKENSFRVEKIDTFSIEKRERSDQIETIFEFTDKNATGGNSGGPLICDGGGVIGLVTQGTSQHDICRATSIDALLNELKLKNE